MPIIEPVVFDAYGTLFDVHSVAVACGELFPGRGQDISRLWRAKQLEYTWLLSLMGRYEDFWRVTERSLRYTCRALRLLCPPATCSRLMDAYLQLALYPDALDGLDQLKGLTLSILSNGSPKMLDAVIQHNGLDGVFREVISADEARTYKPSPRVYELAVKKLQAQPDAIAFVSANAFDFIGAKRFGCRTIWVDRMGQHWTN
ncbi:MAG: haloacid dehalogenase type II [Armatimonadota bacterium]